MQPRTAGPMLPHRRPVELRAHRCGELAMRHLRRRQCRSDVSPNALRHGVEVGVTHYVLEVAEDISNCTGLHAMHANVSQESRLVLRAIHVQVPTISVPRLAHTLDTPEHSHAREQACDVVDELSAC